MEKLYKSQQQQFKKYKIKNIDAYNKNSLYLLFIFRAFTI